MLLIIKFCLFWHLIILNMSSMSFSCLSPIVFLFSFMAAVRHPLSVVHSWWQTVMREGISFRWSCCLRPVSIIELWIRLTISTFAQIWSYGVLSLICNCLQRLANDLGLGCIKATKWLTIALPTTHTLSTNGSFFRAASICSR